MTQDGDRDGTGATPELFGGDWAEAWCAELGRSDAYRKAAAQWEGALALEMTADPESGVEASRAVLVDLHHGHCRGGRAADHEDLAEVPYHIRASPQVWRRLMEGGLDPLWAIMSGKLSLARGSLTSLLPFTRAARELVKAARRVPAALPAGWEEG